MGLFSNTKKELKEELPNSFIIQTKGKFGTTDLKKLFESYLDKHSKKDFEIHITDNVFSVKTEIIKDTKKNKFQYKLYTITVLESSLSIDVIKVISLPTEEKSPISLDQNKDKIIEHLVFAINKQLDHTWLSDHYTCKMELITVLSPLTQNFLLAQLSTKETLLVCLSITNLTSDAFTPPKRHNKYLIFTSHRNLILATDQKEFLLFDISDKTLDIEEKIGKDRIQGEGITFETELLNDTLFVLLKPIFHSFGILRIEQYSDILFQKYPNKNEQLTHIKHLYDFCIENSETNLSPHLKSILIFQFQKQQCAATLLESKKIIELLYNEITFGNVLRQVMSDWKVEIIQQFELLQLLTQNQENFKLKNLAVFYDSVIAGLCNLKKPQKNTFELRLQHLSFLKETQQYQKAISYYEYTIENLKDDSILELISDTKTNVLNGEDCNPLRIQLLEQLLEIKTILNKNTDAELIELAILQPLAPERLTALIGANLLSEKTNTILSLFLQAPFTSDEIISSAKKEYQKEELYDLVVPNCFKKATGFMDSFNSILAQVNPPDYKQVTKFSEKLSSQNYPQAYNSLQQITEQLQMKEIESYIGTGTFEKGIIGVEGSPSFVIIGKNHLEVSHPDYLNITELTFGITQELTHILFQHTRITSKDVWRGAKNKGMDIAGTLLTALPIVSQVGGIAGKFVNVSSLSNLLSGVDKIGNVIEKGQTAIEYGSKITDRFQKNSNEQSNLLATSRLMEISADRVGLLLTKDLKSAVSVLVKSMDDFELVKEKIIKQGLTDYLSQQNKDGDFVHQELIVRIKTLCSFYLRMKW